MPHRREVLAATAAFALCGFRGEGLLDRAIRRAGGMRALRRVRRLGWTGHADVTGPAGQIIQIGLSTVVEPFVRARSESWLLRDGPQKTNTLLIEPNEAWIERTGKTRQPMPAAMAAHERAQYALYGLMLLVTLRDHGASATPGALADTLVAQHPSAPETVLRFDHEANLIEAKNTVPAPDGNGTIDQRFQFEGKISDSGVRWPRRLVIEQHGKPYFDLTLDSFAVNPS